MKSLVKRVDSLNYTLATKWPFNLWTSPEKINQSRANVKQSIQEFKDYKNNRQPNFFERFGSSLTRKGWSLTKKITLTMLLFVFGLALFPFGILLWFVALAILMGNNERKNNVKHGSE